MEEPEFSDNFPQFLNVFRDFFMLFVSLPAGSILHKEIYHREHHDFVTGRVGVFVHIGGLTVMSSMEFHASKYSRAQSVPLHH